MRSRGHLLLPWLVPMAMLLCLLGLNRHPGALRWVLPDAQTRACDESGAVWEASALPRFSRADCQLLRVQSTQRTASWGEGAILIGGLVRDARVHVNGEMLRDFGSDSVSAANRAVLVRVPARLLAAGRTEILVHLRSGAGEYSYIGTLMFGPAQYLAPIAERSWWIGARGALVGLAVTFAIALFLVPITYTRRDESVYRWFLLTLASSSIYVFNFASAWKPLTLSVWAIAIHAALALSLWSLLKFFNRFLGRDDPRGERRIGGLIGAAVALLLIDGLDLVPPMLGWICNGIFRAGMLLTLLYLAALCWRARHRATIPAPTWFAGALLLVATLGVVDSLHVFGVFGGILFSYTLHWGMLYLLLLLFAALVFRILHALGAAERGRGELAVALAERGEELEAEFRLRREAEQARMIAEERHRIMRDMHDGVGGQLVALIGQAQSPGFGGAALQQQLRVTLDDLRLMIDSLDEACADLSVALGMFRRRLEPALAHLPILVHWQTAHLPDLPPAAPTVVLNVLRIVQEAITNALKHARSPTLDISAQWENGRLSIAVIDQGAGFVLDEGHGRGMASMRERARSIGAVLELTSSGVGTTVRLHVAL